MLPVLALLMVQPIAALRMQGTRRAILGAAVAATTAPPLAAHARYTEAAINATASVGIKGKEATKAEPIEVEMNAAEKKLQVGIVARPTRTNLVIIIRCHACCIICSLRSWKISIKLSRGEIERNFALLPSLLKRWGSKFPSP